MANNKIEEEYEEKDLLTHIYETTDTYAGSDQLIKTTLATMKENEKIFLWERLNISQLFTRCLMRS